MEKKKILFLTQSYPTTRGSASTLCTHRVMRSTAAAGNFEVHALCYKFNNESDIDKLDGVEIHRFSPSLFMRLLYKFQAKHKTIYKILITLQKIITIPIYPLSDPISSMRFCNNALDLQKEYNFHLIISEHHGLETLIAGLKLSQMFSEVLHIPILWDPIMGQQYSSYLPSAYCENRIKKLERKSIEFSSLIISMGSMKSFYNSYGDIASSKRRFLDIPGVLPPGCEVETDYLELIKKDSINIIYSGLLTIPSRNPLPVIEMMNQSQYSNRINLVFFCAGNADSQISNAKKCFKGTISVKGYIPLPELHTVYAHADYLLNISDVNANMTPSKIFEYMSYGKPIISTYVTDGDAAQSYLERYPESLCLDLKRSKGSLVKELDTFLSTTHETISYTRVKDIYYNNTPQNYVSLFNELLG